MEKAEPHLARHLTNTDTMTIRPVGTAMFALPSHKVSFLQGFFLVGRWRLELQTR
jgi:hypothetical protein